MTPGIRNLLRRARRGKLSFEAKLGAGLCETRESRMRHPWWRRKYARDADTSALSLPPIQGPLPHARTP